MSSQLPIIVTNVFFINGSYKASPSIVYREVHPFENCHLALKHIFT